MYDFCMIGVLWHTAVVNKQQTIDSFQCTSSGRMVFILTVSSVPVVEEWCSF